MHRPQAVLGNGEGLPVITGASPKANLQRAGLPITAATWRWGRLFAVPPVAEAQMADIQAAGLQAKVTCQMLRAANGNGNVNVNAKTKPSVDISHIPAKPLPVSHPAGKLPPPWTTVSR